MRQSRQDDAASTLTGRGQRGGRPEASDKDVYVVGQRRRQEEGAKRRQQSFEVIAAEDDDNLRLGAEGESVSADLDRFCRGLLAIKKGH